MAAPAHARRLFAAFHISAAFFLRITTRDMLRHAPRACGDVCRKSERRSWRRQRAFAFDAFCRREYWHYALIAACRWLATRLPPRWQIRCCVSQMLISAVTADKITAAPSAVSQASAASRR